MLKGRRSDSVFMTRAKSILAHSSEHSARGQADCGTGRRAGTRIVHNPVPRLYDKRAGLQGQFMGIG
jgi:hypothetical protein